MEATLEVYPKQIFYYCKSGCERFYPDGSFYDKSFEELQFLGSGTHNITLDESKNIICGNEQEVSSTERELNHVRFTLFLEKFGRVVFGEVLYTLVMSFNGQLVDEILKIINDEHIQKLENFASNIPENISKEKAKEFNFMCTASGVKQVPLENLKLLKKHFV